MYTALSGQIAISKQIDVLANNIANASTPGFRAERMIFEKALTKQEVLLGPSLKSDLKEPETVASNEFVGIAGTYTDFSVGPIEKTGNPLDAAIDGEGFFVVQTPQGERYTRAGNFYLNSDQVLTNAQGHPVMGQGGQITANGKSIEIAKDGSILSGGQVLGKLRVVKLDKNNVAREAAQLFRVKDGSSPQEVEKPVVEGGALETSNVNAVQELTSLIIASRLYESYQKTYDASARMNEARNRTMGTLNS